MDSSVCLRHHGIKGMRWGIRRFQNKDGSLTPLGKKRAKGSDDTKEETVEERRARTLKSTDAREIYKNRDILTTAEINERLNRIDTEARLARVAEGTKKSGMEKVDTVIKYARKANEIYELPNTSLGKAIKKALGNKVEENLSPDLKKVWENRSSMTDEQLSKVLKRSNTERAIKKMLDEAEGKKKESDDSKKTDTSDTDKKDTSSENKSSDSTKGDDNRSENPESDNSKVETGKVEDKGTSKFSGWKDGPVVDAEEGKDYWVVSSNTRNTKMSDTTDIVPAGKSYVAGLLEDKSGDS